MKHDNTTSARGRQPNVALNIASLLEAMPDLANVPVAVNRGRVEKLDPMAFMAEVKARGLDPFALTAAQIEEITVRKGNHDYKTFAELEPLGTVEIPAASLTEVAQSQADALLAAIREHAAQ